jgi:hypothetical protein
MRKAMVALTLAAMLSAAHHPVGRVTADEAVERYFRIEWQVGRDRKGPAIDGYIYNQAQRDAERVRVRIERLDAAGAVVGSSDVWVLGGAPQHGRAYFKASVPAAASYRVSISMFDWSCGGGSSGSM